MKIRKLNENPDYVQYKDEILRTTNSVQKNMMINYQRVCL